MVFCTTQTNLCTILLSCVYLFRLIVSYNAISFKPTTIVLSVCTVVAMPPTTRSHVTSIGAIFLNTFEIGSAVVLLAFVLKPCNNNMVPCRFVCMNTPFTHSESTTLVNYHLRHLGTNGSSLQYVLSRISFGQFLFLTKAPPQLLALYCMKFYRVIVEVNG